MDRVTVKVELTDEQALALAQFVKRVGFSECDANAVDKDEAYLMIDALNAVRRELAEVGYAPR